MRHFLVGELLEYDDADDLSEPDAEQRDDYRHPLETTQPLVRRAAIDHH